MTERLYYTDAYLRRFTAQVAGVNGNKVYLDRTAFYPASGGQPFDTGSLGTARVVEVVDEDDRIAHVVEGDLPAGAVEAEIDWARRYDHMQQHSGQHLLSAVLHELFDAPTVSFHLGADYATIDVASAALDRAKLDQAADRVNEIVLENRPIAVSFEEQSESLALRKASGREGTLRVISIERADRSACGGTHVARTGEIGAVQIRGTEKIRGNTRIEFLCGWRTLRRSRADYRALSEAARLFSSQLDEVPAHVASQLARVANLEKQLKKTAIELAQFRGRELHGATAPGADGIRRVEQRLELSDDARTLAIAFASAGKAVYLGISERPPAFLLAASADSGVHAGNVIKSAVTTHRGRGGGSATLGQGSVPSANEFDAALDAVRSGAHGR